VGRERKTGLDRPVCRDLRHQPDYRPDLAPATHTTEPPRGWHVAPKSRKCVRPGTVPAFVSTHRTTASPSRPDRPAVSPSDSLGRTPNGRGMLALAQVRLALGLQPPGSRRDRPRGCYRAVPFPHAASVAGSCRSSTPPSRSATDRAITAHLGTALPAISLSLQISESHQVAPSLSTGPMSASSRSFPGP
jgi:hypothetical protein